MEIIEIYKHVFKFCGWVADENGYARTSSGDEPIILNGKMIALPTAEHLRNPDPTRKVIFHPFSEFASRGESEIIKKMKSSVNMMLAVRFGFLARELMSIVADPKQQKGLSPEQLDVIVGIKEVDQKAITNWNARNIAFIKAGSDRGFLNIHLRRGGEYQGESFARVGLTVFPYYRTLSEETVKLEGIRKGDIETFLQVYRAVFPEISIPEAYNFGYSGQIAPFCSALLLTGRKIALRLNEIVDLYGDRIANKEDIVTDLEWFTPLMDTEAVSAQIRSIPMQEGNDGELIPMPQTVAAPASAEPIVNQNISQSAPQPYSYGQNASPYGGTAPPPPQETAMTSKGLSFKKLMQLNPSLSNSPNLLGPDLAQRAYVDSQRPYAQQTAHYGSSSGYGSQQQSPYGEQNQSPYGRPYGNSGYR